MKKRSNQSANRRTPKAPPILIQWRFGLVCVFISLALVALVARAAFIQVIEPDRLRHEGTCAQYVPNRCIQRVA